MRVYISTRDFPWLKDNLSCIVTDEDLSDVEDLVELEQESEVVTQWEVQYSKPTGEFSVSRHTCPGAPETYVSRWGRKSWIGTGPDKDELIKTIEAKVAEDKKEERVARRWEEMKHAIMRRDISRIKAVTKEIEDED